MGLKFLSSVGGVCLLNGIAHCISCLIFAKKHLFSVQGYPTFFRIHRVRNWSLHVSNSLPVCEILFQGVPASWPDVVSGWEVPVDASTVQIRLSGLGSFLFCVLPECTDVHYTYLPTVWPSFILPTTIQGTNANKNWHWHGNTLVSSYQSSCLPPLKTTRKSSASKIYIKVLDDTPQNPQSSQQAAVDYHRKLWFS